MQTNRRSEYYQNYYANNSGILGMHKKLRAETDIMYKKILYLAARKYNKFLSFFLKKIFPKPECHYLIFRLAQIDKQFVFLLKVSELSKLFSYPKQFFEMLVSSNCFPVIKIDNQFFISLSVFKRIVKGVGTPKKEIKRFFQKEFYDYGI